MFANAMYATIEGDGLCDYRELWRAMSGRGEGRGPGAHRRHRHGGFQGGAAWGPDFPFGPRGPRGWGGPFGRGRKARRGDIRTAALLLLAEEPRNGYQIMQEVQERSEGVWRPSPGSVYPALQQLEDEGLIRSEETDGRKHFAITDAGRQYLAQRDADAPAPWELFAGEHGESAAELGKLFRDMAFAFAQVMRTGSESQMDQAREVLASARRALYHILADGDGPEESPTATNVDGE